MKREFAALANQEFDLVIVGGGAFGAAAAWDATLRGLSVALIEREDFASGASANSFKMVHGGIRYLQHADLPRLRASCHERTAMLRIAPHLVTPLPIVVPTYGSGRQGKLLLGAGMWLYDALTLDRNLRIRDRERRIPFAGFLDAAAVEELFPGVATEGLTGAAVFYDAQMYNPTRLVLAFVTAAADNGALAVNYAQAEKLILAGDSVRGVTVRDRLTGETIDVRARAVLNAAGPWARELVERHRPRGLEGSYSRDAAFLVARLFPHRYALALQGRTRDPDALITRAARHLFLVPWRGYTLCGVWHRVWADPADAVHVTERELQAWIDELNEAMPALDLSLSDVCMWNAGLVPFGDNEPGAEHLSYGKRSHIVDHEGDGLANLVSLVGVRYTMARGDAAKALDVVCRKLGVRAARPPTHRLPLPGGDFESFRELLRDVAREAPTGVGQAGVEALAHNYGTRYRYVLELMSEPFITSECVHGSTTFRAELVHAVREEMAVRLSDVVFRRTDLGTGSHPGRRALEEAAAIVGRELGWDAERRNAEIADVERRFVIGATIEPSDVPAAPTPMEDAASAVGTVAN
ncbi:MAG TPA: glycerol-3-phosphate dehydrogenase/oxidase [Gammaproteobacteria bacterium]